MPTALFHRAPRFCRFCGAVPGEAGEICNRDGLAGPHSYINESESVPKSLIARLMAAIETPGDLTEDDISDLLAEAHKAIAPTEAV